MSAETVVWQAAQESWFRAVNGFARDTSWLHTPARLYAEYGVALFALLLLGSWWLARRGGDLRRVSAALWAPVGMLIAIGLNQVISGAVGEVRPYQAMNNVLVLVSRSTDFSFPSDHAVMAGAVTAGVWLANRKLGHVAAVLAVLMAADRVYVGAHFPLDVVAGLVVGAGVVAASYVLVRPLALRLVSRVSRSPARVLLTAA